MALCTMAAVGSGISGGSSLKTEAPTLRNRLEGSLSIAKVPDWVKLKPEVSTRIPPRAWKHARGAKACDHLHTLHHL